MEEVLQGFSVISALLNVLGDAKEDFLFNSKNKSHYGF
jgi:hypothetical protein